MAYDALPWPPHYQTGHIVATYVNFNGDPVEGTVSFTPRASAAAVTDDATMIMGSTIVAPLTAGVLDLDLPATDDDDARPLDFTYMVTEEFDNASGRPAFDIAVPAGVTTNLLDVSPFEASTGNWQFFGPPGPSGSGGLIGALIFGS